MITGYSLSAISFQLFRNLISNNFARRTLRFILTFVFVTVKLMQVRMRVSFAGRMLMMVRVN